MKKIIIAFCLLSLSACAGVVVKNDTEQALNQQPPLDSSIRTGKLSNGLTYYIKRHQKPEGRVMLWLGVNAGSVLEDDDQQGLAHFVEHMAFNGTENFKKQEIVNYLEKIGMRFGPDLNAYTSFDRTVYQLMVPTDDANTINMGFNILKDWSGALSLEQEEIDKERGVVLEEWRLGRGAMRRMIDELLPVLLQDSQYSDRLPIGKAEIIQNAPKEAFDRFYQDWYRPDLMAVVAVGDLDPMFLEGKIKEHFSSLKNPINPRTREAISVPLDGGSSIVVTTDSERTDTSVSFYRTMPKLPMKTIGDYRRFLRINLYNSMLNERLFALSKKNDAPFLTASNDVFNWVRPVDWFVLEASVKQDGILKAVEALHVEFERVKRYGFSKAEFNRARAKTLRKYNQLVTEKDKANPRGIIEEILRYYFEGDMLPGIDAEFALVERFLPSISLMEINELHQYWDGDDNLVISIGGPDTATIPSEDDIFETINDVASMDIQPYQEKILPKTLMMNRPKAGKIMKRQTIVDLDTVVWTLSNGIRVVLKPTTFKNDEVVFQAFTPGGTSLISDENYDSAKHAASLVSAGGLGMLSETDLRKYLSDKVATANVYIDHFEEGIYGKGSDKDLETLFQLIHLRLVAPRLDDDAVKSWMARKKEETKTRQLDPTTIFVDESVKVLTKDHPRYRPTTLDSLNKVSGQKAYDVYKDRFKTLGDSTFVFVGNMDLVAMEKLVSVYIGSLPKGRSYEKANDNGMRYASGTNKITIKKGKEPKSTVWMNFHGWTPWNKHIENDIDMLDKTLSIRMRELLREELGGVYGVRIRGKIERHPINRYRFDVSFGCAPENVEKLKAAVFSVIDDVQKNGVDKTYIEKIKEARKRSYETDSKTNGYWLGKLVKHYRNGTDPRVIVNNKSRINRVNSNRIQQLSKKFFNKANVFESVLLPEKLIVE